MRSEICGDELNFLFYALTLNDNFIRDCLLSSKAFYNHFLNIKQEGIHIDDALVYQELEKMVFPIIYEESGYQYREDFRAKYIEDYGEEAYRTMQKDCAGFRRTLKRLSQVLYGDPKQWEYDYEDEYGEPYIAPVAKSKVEMSDENEDLGYLMEVCSELKASSLEKLLTEELTVEAFREAGRITDMRHAYEVFAPVFFRMEQLGYKDKPDKRTAYYRLRSVAEDFGNVLFAKKQHWRKDYKAWASKTK